MLINRFCPESVTFALMQSDISLLKSTFFKEISNSLNSFNFTREPLLKKLLVSRQRRMFKWEPFASSMILRWMAIKWEQFGCLGKAAFTPALC